MLNKTLGGRYKIIKQLGSGGFGTTFVAEDRHLPDNPLCVVKQLKPNAAHNPSVLQVARRLFNQEAEVLYQLGHHNQIPKLFAHFEEDEEFYLVQEFVEGHELKCELPTGQKLSEILVATLLQEILEILAFVHQHNVLHRDIKPSNLIRRWQDGKLFLIDFGAVKQITKDVINASGQTTITIAIGSLGYMPSEQMAGKPRRSSDIYAVGMIGVQALTGLHPIDIPEDETTCEIIWRDLATVSDELADILNKMVCYDCRQRYQSVADVLAALKSLKLSQVTPIITSKSVTDENSDYSSDDKTLQLLSEENSGYYQQSQNSLRNRIVVIEGDITKQKVDAIVNPTDLWFSGSGDTDYAIHLAAGYELREACNQLNQDWVGGEAQITKGYNLPASWIIHTVGPLWLAGTNQEEQKLAQCYYNCLALAAEHSISTIAFPAISTGALGFPMQLAAKIAVTEVKFFLERYAFPEKVILVCRGKMSYKSFSTALDEVMA